MFSVISVIVDSLPGTTQNRESTRSWTNRVQLVHSWADVIGERVLFIRSIETVLYIGYNRGNSAIHQM